MTSLPTRLRHIYADDLDFLEKVIEGLQFRVELKGAPYPPSDGKGGVGYSFTLPDEPTIVWESKDLRGL